MLSAINDMFSIEKHPEKGYTLTTSQFFEQERDEVFAFFADAFQLERITPPFLNFKVLTPRPIEIQEGTLIDYSLRLRLLPIRWRTEISIWEPPYRFVDQQLRGPYKKWYHEHTFETVEGGTLVHDKVHYIVPGGSLIHALAVKRDLIKIFDYRRTELESIFAEDETKGSH